MKPILSLRNIVKRFPGVLANDNINLDIYPSEIHSILGENGAGKSTLMNILYGAYGIDEGEVFLEGEEIAVASPKEAIDLGIGMVHQHFMLIPVFSVAENIILGMPGKQRLSMRDIENSVKKAGEKFGLKVDPNAIVSTLSVGEQQRVEILKALYRGAKILILDEPTAVLTPAETQELFVMLRELTEQKVTIIFISHKLNKVMAVSERISVMRRGKMIDTVFTKDTSPEELAQMMVGREVVLRVEKPLASLGDATLKIEGLYVKNEKQVLAVRDLSFKVFAGEIFALTGVDGNGQTELVEAITGLRNVTQGNVNIQGKNATNKSPRQIIEMGSGHIPGDRQKQGLVLDMTIMDNMILECFYKEPYSKQHFMQEDIIEKLAEDLITDYDIRCTGSSVSAGNLSGGNQQKIVVARTIFHEPTLLVAVFPTRGLDVGAIEYIHKRLIEERNRGCAVLLVSTELDEVLSLGDRIGVMYEGELMGIVDGDKADKTNIGLMMAGRKVEEKDETDL